MNTVRGAVEAVLHEWNVAEPQADYVRLVLREALGRLAPRRERDAIERRVIQLDEESAASLVDWRDLSAGEMAEMLTAERR